VGATDKKECEYLDLETGRDVTATELRSLSPDDQKRIIKHWFLERYENPAENTPYDSAEGGYIYIWGGPHDADQVLQEEFTEGFSEEFLGEIADELEEECGTNEWASIPGREDFDLDYPVSDYYPRFEASSATVRRLLNENINASDQPAFHALLYANVITLLEAYLSDVFVSLVLKHESLLQKFVESDPAFKTQKFSIAEVFQQHAALPRRVLDHLYLLPFHRLEKVQQMYLATFGIRFPDEMSDISKAVQIRHDIVHRNCLAKDDKLIVLSRADVERLLTTVGMFVNLVDGDVRGVIEQLEISPSRKIPMTPDKS
jgi:hypothetical protein